MKKLILVALIVCATFNTTYTIKANAQVTYAMVVTEKAYFYSDQSCKIVKFQIPYSYYVKVVSVGNDVTRVIYQDDSSLMPLAEGYIKNVDLNFNFQPTVSPYPQQTLCLKCDEVIFSEPNKTTPKAVLSSQTNAMFYGYTQIDGEDFCFVYAQGLVGYVRLSSFENFSLPLHPDEILLHQTNDNTSVQQSSSTNQNVNENSTSSSQSQIIIIFVVLCVLLIVVYLVLQPNKKLNFENNIFNENEE